MSSAPPRSLGLLFATLAALLALAAIVAAGADARDSEAPPGKGHNWLPCDDWVMLHWVPFDEPDLYRVLGIGRFAVLRWLRDDNHHTLAQLVRRRGMDPRALAARLVEGRGPQPGQVSVRELRDRVERTLTQGHLAQHLLFHRFHQPAIALGLPRRSVSRRSSTSMSGWAAGLRRRSPAGTDAHGPPSLAVSAPRSGGRPSRV